MYFADVMAGSLNPVMSNDTKLFCLSRSNIQINKKQKLFQSFTISFNFIVHILICRMSASEVDDSHVKVVDADTNNNEIPIGIIILITSIAALLFIVIMVTAYYIVKKNSQKVAMSENTDNVIAQAQDHVQSMRFSRMCNSRTNSQVIIISVPEENDRTFVDDIYAQVVNEVRNKYQDPDFLSVKDDQWTHYNSMNDISSLNTFKSFDSKIDEDVSMYSGRSSRRLSNRFVT